MFCPGLVTLIYTSFIMLKESLENLSYSLTMHVTMENSSTIVVVMVGCLEL